MSFHCFCKPYARRSASHSAATAADAAEGHFGLEGIRNRLEKLDGTFTIDSKPGDGTKATISIPLPSSQRQENS